MKKRMALYLQDAHSIRDGMEIARYAEAKGFEAVWQADSRLVRDATIPMAAFAATTERIKVGAGVVDIWSRNPARLASTFATLDDLAPGRIILGVGAWWDPLATKVGIERRRPLLAMREIVGAVRGLLAGEKVSFDGEFVHLDGVEIDYVYQERGGKDLPIYIGATGMQMMELTGEIADGAVLNYLVSPDYNQRALDALEKGARRTNRSLDEIDRPQLIVCSMAADRQEAIDAARLLVTQYLGPSCSRVRQRPRPVRPVQHEATCSSASIGRSSRSTPQAYAIGHAATGIRCSPQISSQAPQSWRPRPQTSPASCSAPGWRGAGTLNRDSHS